MNDYIIKCLKNHSQTKNSFFIALIDNSRGLEFDKNLVNIFNKVVCLAYSRSGSVIEKIYSKPRFT